MYHTTDESHTIGTALTSKGGSEVLVILRGSNRELSNNEDGDDQWTVTVACKELAKLRTSKVETLTHARHDTVTRPARSRQLITTSHASEGLRGDWRAH